MSLLMRRRMMMQTVCTKELFNIETARIETDSWRNVEYTVSDGAITITKGSYSWTAVYVYLDNCIQGKSYNISFKCNTERESYPTCSINIDGKTTNLQRSEEIKGNGGSFECGTNTPILNLYFSNNNSEKIPVTYYDFVLEEI